MALTTYVERLAEALGVPADKDLWKEPDKGKAKALATALKVTPQAIEKFFRDSSKAMSAANNSRAAKHLRVDSDWLATGEGDKVTPRVWPYTEQATSLALRFDQEVPEALKPAIHAVILRHISVSAEAPTPAEEQGELGPKGRRVNRRRAGKS